MSNCRHLVGSFEHNPALKRELKATQTRLSYSTKTKLYSEVKTRYAYIYKMLDSISSNNHALELMAQDTTINHAIVDYIPSKDEFQIIDELANLIHPLQEFITILGAKY